MISIMVNTPNKSKSKPTSKSNFKSEEFKLVILGLDTCQATLNSE